MHIAAAYLDTKSAFSVHGYFQVNNHHYGFPSHKVIIIFNFYNFVHFILLLSAR